MSNTSIKVDLKFGADVSAAKKAMEELHRSLIQVSNVKNPGSIYTKDLNEASRAAAQLRVQLQNAFNQDTGKLNLNKLNSEMQKSGMSIEKYRAKLAAIGPQGQQTFNQLAYAIATADTQTLSLSNGLRRLGSTFMNTLRYQLSSSLIMGFTRGIGEAINYVKDLNGSLNDIRIVTGLGAEEMKKFANEANKAAKALNTTTNEYAKASLIYFQQGLNDQQVKERTELTIKMANVTGQAVKEVSDQLTAVWNNFDNGTRSLEYYIDVITALGATTASSSEEITQGLEKFAAVAETVGLSYEYAASALATVTAETRQSADVVGTAFKTLFARIQDLELGKTLDDGTTLGQYSQALAAVGINIKNTSGEVKDMNNILDEMGAKWNTLTQAQQVALAQNVAGTRQYTQLIALMSNWDTFQENLNTSLNSSGALQEQADIYAESWQAASDRVKASLETIYDHLLDDSFFIDATDTLANFIGLIDNLIEGLGGLPGVLALVGGALMRVFSAQMANGINNVVMGFRAMTASGRAANQRMQEEAIIGMRANYGTSGAGAQQGELTDKAIKVQTEFIQNKNKMLDIDRQVAELQINQLEDQRKMIEAQLQEQKILEQNLAIDKKRSQVSEETLSKRFGFGEKKFAKANENEQMEEYWNKDSKVINGVGNRGQFVMIGEEQRKKAFANLRSSSAAQSINSAIGFGDQSIFAPLTDKSAQASAGQMKNALDELQSRLKNLGSLQKKFPHR